ncbi:MAG: MauE/DoxX family redox-associated membrane protein [Patescibacteria group bacterium]|jgi:uncharacterized membrane protein YphA (DoxX/SURF4 family)
MHIARHATFAGWGTFFLRLAIGGVFIFSAVGKLLEPREEVLGAVRAFNLLPNPLDVWYATLLPWVELLAGMMMVLGLYRRYAAVALLLLLLSFFIAIEHARGSDDILAACGCFGIFRIDETLEEILARDVILFLIAAWTLVSPKDRFALSDRL